jgi:predicted Rossmann fold nucleotide-binding protein DprA/Smf involved in DNA uptake
VKDLSEQNITIISGLAFGIDAMAHKAGFETWTANCRE